MKVHETVIGDVGDRSREYPVTLRDAVDAALGITEKQDTVLFTGSLYMVGDAMVILRKRNNQFL